MTTCESVGRTRSQSQCNCIKPSQVSYITAETNFVQHLGVGVEAKVGLYSSDISHKFSSFIRSKYKDEEEERNFWNNDMLSSFQSFMDKLSSLLCLNYACCLAVLLNIVKSNKSRQNICA